MPRLTPRLRKIRNATLAAGLFVAVALAIGKPMSRDVLQAGYDQMDRGEIVAAMENFDRVMVFNMFSAKYIAARAQAHLYLGNYQRALWHYDWAILLSGGGDDAYSGRAQVYRMLANVDANRAAMHRVAQQERYERPWEHGGYFQPGLSHTAYEQVAPSAPVHQVALRQMTIDQPIFKNDLDNDGASLMRQVEELVDN